MTDVNQALFDQRRSAINSGAVTRRDDGSWVQADKTEVVGRDGLDMTSGMAALYTTTPAWHGLGTVIPGGTADIDQVLKLAHIEFQVVLVPAEYDWLGERREHEGMFHTVRDDTGDPLGIVGSKYRTIQNRDGFEFLQDLTLEYGAPWESAGALRNGRRTFVSMHLPRSVTIDADGIADEIVPFIVALNSHDGTTAFRVVVTPWRPVCSNTERFAVRDAYTSWSVRHTVKAEDRLHEARRTLNLSMNYFDAFQVEETALAQTDLAIDEFHKLINELWPLDADASKRTKTTHKTRHDKLDDLTRVGRNFPGTAYGAERAVTEYLDHLSPVRPGRLGTESAARATQLLEGADDELKSRAHKRLMTLVRR